MSRTITTEPRSGGITAATFAAMASPCEILFEGTDAALALELGTLAAAEAWRIEDKFSRYLPDSVISRINRSGGTPVALDAETVSLMQFAERCHALSDGAFDITSGVLRRAWRFDGGEFRPARDEIVRLRERVGFERLAFAPPLLTVPEGMELDLGGLGKEYAVDRALGLLVSRAPGAVLVNFGGDLAANRAPMSGPWQVAVERPDTDREARLLLDFSSGGLATSGDTRRFVFVDGVRYGHILDVRTGWPVTGAPRSVTVAGGTCVEAGLLATLAMLHGHQAEAFLGDQQALHWCLR